MRDFTIVVPFWNGHRYLPRLLATLPESIQVLIVDDQSDDAVPQHLNRKRTRVMRLDRRGYFAGAVNAGVEACEGDVLILNQDAYFDGERWLRTIERHQGKHATFGEGVFGHPAWPKGYVQGTFMYVDRNAWERVGPLNDELYPLWGCTCEWQLRACRLGYTAKPIDKIPDFVHAKGRRVRWGEAITSAIMREPEERRRFIRTPPLISVIVPCYNYANYLPQAIASLVGGDTDLGTWEKPGQTLQSFEIIIVDDASPDETPEVGKALADRWKGIRYVRLKKNRGTAGALNAGIRRAFGEFIHILSADDLRRPYTLERLHDGCSNGHKEVAYGNLTVFRSGKIIKPLKMGDYNPKRLLHRNCMPAGIMYPRRAWEDAGGYPEVMGDGREDWAFNIALAQAGWCGFHIGKDSGNLVRREGTNRSVRTAQSMPNAHAYYKQKIMDLFPELYEGDWPVGCRGCGRGRSRSKAAKAQTLTTPKEGLVLLEYIGGNAGVMTWDAPSGQRYRFGGTRSRGYVQPGDVNWFLERRRNTNLLFRRVKIETPKQETEEQVEPIHEEHDLTEIRGVAEATAEKLRAGGYISVAEIAEANAEEMAELCGIAVGYAERYIAGAQDVLG